MSCVVSIWTENSPAFLISLEMFSWIRWWIASITELTVVLESKVTREPLPLVPPDKCNFLLFSMQLSRCSFKQKSYFPRSSMSSKKLPWSTVWSSRVCCHWWTEYYQFSYRMLWTVRQPLSTGAVSATEHFLHHWIATFLLRMVIQKLRDFSDQVLKISVIFYWHTQGSQCLSGDPVFVLVTHSSLSTAFSLSGGAVFGLPALVWLSPWTDQLDLPWTFLAWT